jgi:hypothetical protein
VFGEVDLHHVFGLRFHNRLLPLLAHCRLHCGKKPRPQAHAGGSQHQCRRQSPPVGDPTGGDHRDRPRLVHHLRHQRHGSDGPAEAAGLASLCDQDIGSCVTGDTGLGHRGHLVDEAGANFVSTLYQVTGLAQGERNDRRTGFKDRLEDLLAERPAGEVDCEGPVGQFPDLGDPAQDLLRALQRRGDAPQAAGVGHCGDQPGRDVPGPADGPLDDGDLDLQNLAERCPKNAVHEPTVAPAIVRF